LNGSTEYHVFGILFTRLKPVKRASLPTLLGPRTYIIQHIQD